MFNRFTAMSVLSASLILSGCGTLTGIPSHGGGKRFATEQRLVSASIRASLRGIDVSALRGRKVSVLFSIISDQGAGNLSGGRLTLGAMLKGASLFSPTTATASQFQVFDLISSGTNYANTAGTSGSSATATTISSGNGTSSSNSNGSSNSATTTSQSGTSNGTNNSSTNVGGVTTTQNGSNTGASNTTTTTGAVTTNQNGTSNGTSNLTTNTGSSTNTTNGTSSGSSSSNGTANTTTNSSSSNNGSTTSNNSQNSNSASNGNSASNQTGGNVRNNQVVSPAPSYSTQRTKGKDASAALTLRYNGLGNYQNMAIAISDAQLLIGLVRNYLLLNGVQVTLRPDKTTSAVVYVTVDIFGIVRSRFDAYVYNKESVKAETGIEMFAFDRRGRLIMKPTSSVYEAHYGEHYFFWAGPFGTDKKVRKGEPLLVDFSDVDGSQRTYGSRKTIRKGPAIP